jgi:hypothetical protein
MDAQPHEKRFGRDRAGRFDADILAHQTRTIGEEFADRNAAAELLRATLKPLLAKLTIEAQGRDPDLSRIQAQQVAECSDTYAEHVRATVEAERLAARARAQWEAVKSFARSVQTMEANQRVERSSYR